MNKMTQWMAVAFSTWFTWLIYISQTHHGTEAQADMVPWIVWILFAVSLNSFRMDDFFLVQLRPKSHWLKAGADINILAQVFLLVVTGHWLLAAARGVSEVIARGNCNAAHQRLDQENWKQRLREDDTDKRADLSHQ